LTRCGSTIALTAAELAGTPGSPALWWSFENGFTQTHNVMRPAPDSGSATPGSTVHCDNAYVRGGAAVSASGKFGSALTLNGTNGSVELPYTPATALGSGDFTISTWLKYSATGSSADQVLLWAYGVGASERQIWIRAQPSKDWLYAAFETDVATTTIAAPDSSSAVAFGDNQWHHIALERSGGTLSLIVDGATLGSASVPAGSVTYPDAFAVDGFQLGAKPGGSDPLNGSLDEFRIFHKALSADELTSVRLNNTDLGTVTGVRLPFDVATGSSYARM
jgi:sialidase-1